MTPPRLARSRPGRPRRWWPLGVIALMVLTMTACTPGISGFMAVGRTSDGHAVALFQSCGDEEFSKIILRTGKRENDQQWLSPDGEVDRAAVELTADSPWATGTSNGTLAPGVDYELSAFDDGGYWKVDVLRFTAEDLADLEPGQVLFDYYDKSTKDFTHTITSSDEFLANICRGDYRQR